MYASTKIALSPSLDAEKDEFVFCKESVHAEGPERTSGVTI